MHFFVRGRAGQAFVFERRGPPQVREGAPVVDLFAKKMRGPLAKKILLKKKRTIRRWTSPTDRRLNLNAGKLLLLLACLIL